MSRAGSLMSALVRAVVLMSVTVLVRLRAADLPQTWASDLLMVAAGIYVLLSTFVAASKGEEEQVTNVMVAMDLLFITALVWQAGGIGSNYVLLYFLPVMHASIRLHIRQAIACSILSALCYSLVVFGKGGERMIVSSGWAHLAFFSGSALVLALFFGALSQALAAQRALSTDLEQTVEKLKAVSQIARQAARMGSTDVLLDHVADLAARRLDAVACYIALTDSSGALQVRTARGAASAGTQLPAFERESAERCLVLLTPRWQRVRAPETDARAAALTCICAPLATGSLALGAIQLFSLRRSFSATEADWLSAVTDEAAIAIENARLQQEVYRLSVTDELTGLYHRLEFEKLVEMALGRLEHENVPLGILLLDIDGLKGVNRQFGHAAGDQVLLAVADVLRRSVRASDAAARYGEDEFGVMLPGADLEGTRVVAARLREILGRSQFEFPPYPGKCTITACVGAAVCQRGVGIRAHEAIACAQQALAQAKQEGHGQIRFWDAGFAAPESVITQVRALVDRFGGSASGKGDGTWES
jgi:diguanylate cyclase (GGDEF)-like protein